MEVASIPLNPELGEPPAYGVQGVKNLAEEVDEELFAVFAVGGELAASLRLDARPLRGVGGPQRLQRQRDHSQRGVREERREGPAIRSQAHVGSVFEDFKRRALHTKYSALDEQGLPANRSQFLVTHHSSLGAVLQSPRNRMRSIPSARPVSGSA